MLRVFLVYMILGAYSTARLVQKTHNLLVLGSNPSAPILKEIEDAKRT
jgi:hypothetical protein